MLEELTRTSYQPAGAFTFFVSQNWESADSPDNELGTKLAWLKRLKAHPNPNPNPRALEPPNPNLNPNP